MCPTISGCFNNRIKPAIAVATKIITLISKNKSIGSNYILAVNVGLGIKSAEILFWYSANHFHYGIFNNVPAGILNLYQSFQKSFLGQ